MEKRQHPHLLLSHCPDPLGFRHRYLNLNLDNENEDANPDVLPSLFGYMKKPRKKGFLVNLLSQEMRRFRFAEEGALADEGAAKACVESLRAKYYDPWTASFEEGVKLVEEAFPNIIRQVHPDKIQGHAVPRKAQQPVERHEKLVAFSKQHKQRGEEVSKSRMTFSISGVPSDAQPAPICGASSWNVLRAPQETPLWLGEKPYNIQGCCEMSGLHHNSAPQCRAVIVPEWLEEALVRAGTAFSQVDAQVARAKVHRDIEKARKPNIASTAKLAEVRSKLHCWKKSQRGDRGMVGASICARWPSKGRTRPRIRKAFTFRRCAEVTGEY